MVHNSRLLIFYKSKCRYALQQKFSKQNHVSDAKYEFAGLLRDIERGYAHLMRQWSVRLSLM